MATDNPEAFDEDAISLEDAFNASPRFLATRNGDAVVFRRFDGDDTGVHLVSKDEVLLFLDAQLEAGLPVKAG